MVSGSNLKCLMIGQAGIGKTKLLNSLPNITNVTSSSDVSMLLNKYNSTLKEVYLLDVINDDPSPFDFNSNLKLEIHNYDIEIETCLHENDLIINNKVIPSNQIINVSNYKIIVFCYAVDDESSFELVKSKWDIDLKKLRSKFNKSHHQFILMALKSDLVNKKSSKVIYNDLIRPFELISNNNLESSQSTDIYNNINSNNNNINAADAKLVNDAKYRKRTCSTHSNSSTSKLDESIKKKRLLNDDDDEVENDADNVKLVSNSLVKKFAKSIDAKFVQMSSFEKSGHESFLKALIDGCSITNKKPVKIMETNAQEQTNVKNIKNKSLNIKSKLPKSMSAPIYSLINRTKKSNNKNKLIETDESNVQTYKYDSELGELVLIDDESKQQQTETNQQQQLKSTINTQTLNNLNNNNLTLKQKLSQFFIGFGTYIVTCGSHKSRIKGNAKSNNYSKNQNKFLIMGKNKSWLLLGSELSLNTMANDDVFVN